MTTITTDPEHPDLTRGVDAEPVPQAAAYLVLSPEEISKGFCRPVRFSYIHEACGTQTEMSTAIAETYARDNTFYGSTYCCACMKHLAVSEFKWLDGSTVGS